MEKIIKILLVGLLAFNTTLVFASNDDFSVEAKNQKDKSISFALNEGNTLKISILDEAYNLIFDQSVNAKSKSLKTYDLRNLPNGTYTLIAESESKSTEYKVTITKDKAVFSDEKVMDVFKPVFEAREGYVLLQVNKHASTPIEVVVFNDNNEEVYNNTFKDRDKLAVKFNTEDASNKNLTFVVKYNNETYINTISAN